MQKPPIFAIDVSATEGQEARSFRSVSFFRPSEAADRQFISLLLPVSYYLVSGRLALQIIDCQHCSPLLVAPLSPVIAQIADPFFLYLLFRFILLIVINSPTGSTLQAVTLTALASCDTRTDNHRHSFCDIRDFHKSRSRIRLTTPLITPLYCGSVVCTLLLHSVPCICKQPLLKL